MPSFVIINGCIVREQDTGRMWLDVTRVQNLEEADLQDFDIIQIKGNEYELQGRRPSDGWWWIIPFEVDVDSEPNDPRTQTIEAA